MPQEVDLVVVDDSGLLGLVDTPSYVTFVSEDWEYDELIRHFAAEMQRGTLLVWDCADGGNDYRVRVRDRLSTQQGFREATSEIVATGNRLHLASYTALTMAAQFRDCALPGEHEEDLAIPVVPGRYRVRIVQMYDPEALEHLNGEPHFLVEMELGHAERWRDVAWRAA